MGYNLNNAKNPAVTPFWHYFCYQPGDVAHRRRRCGVSDNLYLTHAAATLVALFLYHLCWGWRSIAFRVYFPKRFTRQPVPGNVLVPGIVVWHPIGCRPVVAAWQGSDQYLLIVMVGGILVIESLLRLVERSTLKPDETSDACADYPH